MASREKWSIAVAVTEQELARTVPVERRTGLVQNVSLVALVGVSIDLSLPPLHHLPLPLPLLPPPQQVGL